MFIKCGSTDTPSYMYNPSSQLKQDIERFPKLFGDTQQKIYAFFFFRFDISEPVPKAKTPQIWRFHWVSERVTLQSRIDLRWNRLRQLFLRKMMSKLTSNRTPSDNPRALPQDRRGQITRALFRFDSQKMKIGSQIYILFRDDFFHPEIFKVIRFHD